MVRECELESVRLVQGEVVCHTYAMLPRTFSKGYVKNVIMHVTGFVFCQTGEATTRVLYGFVRQWII